MFDIDICYKYIFESLFEEDVLDCIAEKVHNYADCSVIYMLISGEIVAASGNDSRVSDAIQRGHCTIEMFDWFREIKDSLLVAADIIKDNRTVGYSIILFSDVSKRETYEKVSQLLSQAAEMHFEDTEVEVYENISMRKQIYAWTLFEGRKEEIKELEKEVEGKYMLALFPCEDAGKKKQKLFQQIQAFWNECYVFSEEDFLYIVFFHFDEKGRKTVLKKLEKLDTHCCISELFSDLELCSYKRDLLKRMNLINEYGATGGMMLEKDWYTEVVYSHALPMIQKAGLQDYSINLLLEEDAMKHTNLYETLKMYFMCENNLVDTASRLNIHRNTLVYRIKQIRLLTGRDINDPKVSREMLTYMVLYDISKQAGE